MVCSRSGAFTAAPVKPGSRKPQASGAISSTAAASTSRASCQPSPAIRKPSTGTMRNWPKEPAAAATPIAQERRAGSTWRPITPYTTA